MNYFNNADIGNMRRDALRRTREMHRQNINSGNNNINKESAHKKSEPEKISQPEILPENSQQTPCEKKNNTPTENRSANKNMTYSNNRHKSAAGINNLLSGIFTDGKFDNDKIIIIALIILLAKEGADIKLLIALGYILM